MLCWLTWLSQGKAESLSQWRHSELCLYFETQKKNSIKENCQLNESFLVVSVTFLFAWKVQKRPTDFEGQMIEQCHEVQNIQVTDRSIRQYQAKYTHACRRMHNHIVCFRLIQQSYARTNIRIHIQTKHTNVCLCTFLCVCIFEKGAFYLGRFFVCHRHNTHCLIHK